MRRIANLSRFVAGLLLSGTLAPAALKIVDFGGGADTSARACLHRRLLLQALLSAPYSRRAAVHTVFQTIAAKGLGHGGEMGALRASLGQALVRAFQGWKLGREK